MKTKLILFFIATLCFSILFYKQSQGLNYLLFSLILISSSMAIYKNTKSLQFIIVSAGLLISGIFTMYYGNNLAISMAIISVLILLVIQKWKRSSLITALLNGMGAVSLSLIIFIKDRVLLNKIKQRLPNKENKKINKVVPIVITIAVVFIFASLYRTINPIFDKQLANIVGELSWGWIFFTLFGALLLYTFFFSPRYLKQYMAHENKLPNHILESNIPTQNSIWGNAININSERLSAILIFSALNILLLILNITDTNYLFFQKSLPYGLTYSDYVHNGVTAVITSIILAISLILFYYRGELNFNKKSTIIKVLTYIWITQNIILVIMTIFKNHMYIEEYSLTFKRIGVYYYLLFSVIGLLLTIYKLYAKQSLWLLIKNNVLSIYIVLILSCLFNWNGIVTNYNIKQKDNPDLHYLSQLGFANYPTLWKLDGFEQDQKRITELNLNGKSMTYYLPYKIARFLENYPKGSFQSYCSTRKNTYDFFTKLAEEGTLDLYTEYIQQNPEVETSKNR